MDLTETINCYIVNIVRKRYRKRDVNKLVQLFFIRLCQQFRVHLFWVVLHYLGKTTSVFVKTCKLELISPATPHCKENHSHALDEVRLFSPEVLKIEFNSLNYH